MGCDMPTDPASPCRQPEQFDDRAAPGGRAKTEDTHGVARETIDLAVPTTARPSVAFLRRTQYGPRFALLSFPNTTP
jgi:hypothetical protein